CVATRDPVGADEAEPERQGELELAAEPVGADVVDTPFGSADRVVAEDAPEGNLRAALHGRKRRALAEGPRHREVMTSETYPARDRPDRRHDGVPKAETSTCMGPVSSLRSRQPIGQ